MTFKFREACPEGQLPLYDTGSGFTENERLTVELATTIILTKLSVETTKVHADKSLTTAGLRSFVSLG